jgi:hypothetical protein
MVRSIAKPLLATVTLLALAGTIAGCSSGAVLERMPESIGGLPADAPAPPATPYQYPAVHDMPPPRPDTPMSEEQQYRAEKDLAATRDRQEADTGTTPGKKAAPAAKNPTPPAGDDENTDQTAGSKTNP